MSQSIHSFPKPPSSNPFLAARAVLDLAPSSPFAQPQPHALAVAEDAAPGTYTYALVKSGPAPTANEVEESAVDAAEINVMWGSNVLSVAHLSPLRAYYIGEESGPGAQCDCFVPAEALGVTRRPLVRVEGGVLYAVVPDAATGSVEIDGVRQSLTNARVSARRSAEASDAYEIALPRGARLRFELGGFAYSVGAVAAGKRVKRGATSFDRGIGTAFAAAFCGIAGLMGVMAYTSPALGLAEDDGLSRERLYLMQQYLDAAAQREQNKPEEQQAANAPAAEKGGDAGQKAKFAEGKMGKPDTTAQGNRYTVKKVDDDPRLARSRAIEEARTFGLVSLLTGDPNAPTAPFGGDTASGHDDASFQGNMWGDTPGDSYGMNGLGLSGLEQGGGGRGEGIGLTDFGGLGNGLNQGPGGWGRGAKLGGGTHTPKAPKIGIGTTQVSGKLPPEVIQRIVRQNYGRFRMCYENGLAKNPNLAGRVTARFVIGRDGAVSNVSNGGSDLPDSSVVSCVIRSYYGLSFPVPSEGGIVTVVYPISFQPG